MGVLELNSRCKVPRLDLELSSGCDHRCAHCYNVWNALEGEPQGGYPRGQLPTAEYLAMVEKAIRQSGATHLTITGGEPLLRKNALEIIERTCALVESVLLITNGSHVSMATAKRLATAGVRSVQLTFLSATPEEHDRLKGARSFDDTVRACMNLHDERIPVQACFVATNQNWHDFPCVIELCLALGIRSIVYNRMSPAGWAVNRLADLLPEVDQVRANLEAAEKLGRRWGIRVVTAMPIPPCLIRAVEFPWVQFGFCSTGTSSPNLVIDPMGNVRSCNLSRTILGNIVHQDWAEIMRNPYPREFRRRVPDACRGCEHAQSCQGGCKESAFAVMGDLRHQDPFVALARAPGGRSRGQSPRLRVLSEHDLD
ncbi:MAG: radical SAM protein [Deltaproteobacteria bacterium]|nr:radical SAM protein [Deltaproteobacteria bacterium]